MLLAFFDEFGLDSRDVTIEVPSPYASAIRTQICRIETADERARFCDAVLRHLARVMADFLDADIRPPTEKQVLFAYSLAKRHRVDVPRCDLSVGCSSGPLALKL
ncbi:hypothetical protein, partial [Salinisphaera shabanensis]|uniref:hypothetical protein n=1 Tax=Salinisphaera shabanensis TaxID=180542 RepID=UPI00333F77D4